MLGSAVCLLNTPTHLPACLQGFTNAKWVEGELLVFGGDSPFVRGAQLGFTFDVRANQRWVGGRVGGSGSV